MSIKLFSIYSHSNTLRGIIIKPKDAVYPCKTAIVSHGFASNLTITSPYAKTLVKAGYVTVLFDFCMSGSGLSSGNSTGMSVLTEKENLNDLLYYVKRLPYVDEKISCLQAAVREVWCLLFQPLKILKMLKLCCFIILLFAYLMTQDEVI